LLSTPDVSELPDKFSRYFGRAADFILTGHFYDITINPSSFATTSSEQTFTVNGLKTSDFVMVNKPTETTGVGIGNCRVSAANTLAITFTNATGGSVDPASETYLLLVVRREKE